MEAVPSGLCHDSRLFKEGDLFIAIRGNQFDGHLFVAEACAKGASGVVVEDDRVVPLKYKGAVVKVKSTKEVVAPLAARYHNYPTEKLVTIGVTGTNGKTTTTYMIESVLAEEIPCAVLGTVDNHFKSEKLSSTHTTPDALDLQKMLAHFYDLGARAAALEVSSHALALERVNLVHFDVGVFTNLTRDHLDFHKDMESYFQAKAKLFFNSLRLSSKKSKRAVINTDDPYGAKMQNPEIPTWFYGLESGDIQIVKYQLSLGGSLARIKTPSGDVEVKLPMIGLHNLFNAMAAIGVGLHLGLKLQIIAERLDKLKQVRGRLEKVSSSSPVHVFVDYAHTDDALRNVLEFLKNLRKKLDQKFKIITVFGCGGDRDKGKRPAMMQAAEKFSDLIFVTSDNPRTENPESIINDILTGATPTKIADGIISVEPDRRLAIHKAIARASAGDVVLIAGKGHEDYQIVGTKKLPFDDIKVAQEGLSQ